MTQSEAEKIRNDLKWAEVRKIRDAMISETDWTQVPDSPLAPEKKAEFTAYRQALRDIPQDYINSDDVIWPEKPTL
ncbi:TPA: tail fiber assembly protein [Vibrio parahaemolyticus]